MSKIKGLLIEEMPREKLVSHGPQYLNEVELLAIILRSGTHNKNVIELSREILTKFNSQKISRITYEELLKIKGISKAKATTIISVFELSRRFSNKNNLKVKINSSQDIFDLVKENFLDLDIEKVMLIQVDSKNNVLKKEFVSEGGINFSIIDCRQIIKKVIINNSSGIILVHNHPSWEVEPSDEDLKLTKKLKKQCNLLDIRFLDHLIVSNNNYYSMFDCDDL